MIFEKVMLNICVYMCSSFAEIVLSEATGLTNMDKSQEIFNFDLNSTDFIGIKGRDSRNSSITFNEVGNVTERELDTILKNTPNPLINNDSLEISLADWNLSEVVKMEHTFSPVDVNTHGSNNDKLISEVSLTMDNKSPSKPNKIMKSNEPDEHNIPYNLINRKDRVQTFTLSRSKMQLQHHLQLAPMEDVPLGTLMAKQKRYLVTVLVPIGVGIVGAALIVCTILTLRKVARQRSLQVPFDDAEVERSITPSVSSICRESNDKVFLLFGDEEI